MKEAKRVRGINLPEWIWQAVEKEAQESCRDVNKQITYVLTQRYKQENGNG
jgi:hypothetical protein